jgi:hypothetical protein
MMKKLFALIALLETLSVTARAATATSWPTNFVQNISVQFLVVIPGATAANGLSGTVDKLTIGTKETIQAIGLATTNSFSGKAQLVGVEPLYYFTNMVVTTNKGKALTNNYVYGFPGNPAFQIRDGNKVVDVTKFITFATLSSNTTLASFVMNRQGGYPSYKSYSIQSIAISSAVLTLSGQAFVETDLVNITVEPGVVVWATDDYWTSFTGVATSSKGNGVLQGVLTGTYLRLE